MSALLELEGVNVFYGGIHAVRDLSASVNTGEVVTLIGANGAGKSTTLRAIAGLLTPASGRITFEGEAIAGIPAHKLVARGISMSPEGRGIFANLTVLENLEMGAYLRTSKSEIRQDLDRGFALFPRLLERMKQPAGTTVLLVEQNANAALKHSDRAYVLETGAVVLEGSAADIAKDQRVRESYLGE